MLHGMFALLRHEILPSGPSGLVVLGVLVALVAVAILFAFHAVQTRLTLGSDDLFSLFRLAAVVALVLSATVGIFVGSMFGGVFAVGMPALAGFGASTLVIHRRAQAMVLPGTKALSQPDSIGGEVAIAAAAFGGGALAVLALPWILMGIALA